MTLLALTIPARAFEGQINIVVTQAGQSNALRYTVGPEHLRIEMTATNWPSPIDIVERQSGALTLVYPHNRSFVRLKPAAVNAPAGIPGFPDMPLPPGGLPPGIGPQANFHYDGMTTPTQPGGAPNGADRPVRQSTIGPAPGALAFAPPVPPMPPAPKMPVSVTPPITNGLLVGQLPVAAVPPGAAPGIRRMPPPGMLVPPGVGPVPPQSPNSNFPSPGQVMLPVTNGIPREFGQRPGGPLPGAPRMAAMPKMAMAPPSVMNGPLELKATGQATNLLGFACQQYELKERGETMELWATDQLLPYQPYLRHQPHRVGPQRIEERWPELVAQRQLFPLFASQRHESGVESFRFEVTAVMTSKIDETSETLFQPPADYHEVQPLPF
jgi:hypothetical protein